HIARRGLPPFCGVKTKPPQNYKGAKGGLKGEQEAQPLAAATEPPAISITKFWISNWRVEAVHRPRRAAASPSQHTGDEPRIVLRPQMIFGIIEGPAVLVAHNDRVIDDNIKALGNAARIRAPWCSGLNRDLMNRLAHTTAHPFGYSISRRHLSLNDLVVAK